MFRQLLFFLAAFFFSALVNGAEILDDSRDHGYPFPAKIVTRGAKIKIGKNLKGLPLGVIIGISVGMFVGILAVLLVVYFLLRRNEKKYGSLTTTA
ncbi:hypothetical protein QBC42DRAFT_284429 [Cladorrhinum samala]|uniref:Uncharacterized protein n=1 Tax=Cladorrhinum samala TaxID=585594 RepID=A0AAV9HWL7_9PEZI|nr:hypothetical protein QBC42DRAFT_284429 [Cladorrhinum samala]